MTVQSNEPPRNSLAIHGGPKAVPALKGKIEPKIGVDEFLALARRFGFSTDAIDRIACVISNEDLPVGGPFLARYFGAVPSPPAAEQYENLVRETLGIRHVMAVSSGTGALHGAMAAVGAGPGTEVIVPAMGFMATGMAVALAGGIPVYCDVDESLQIDPSKLEELITERTVALAPTHHWGNVCDMKSIMAIAGSHNLRVVEDCAQAPGALCDGRFVGTIGDVGCFSIAAYKIVGGGESGLVVTGDQLLFDRICQLIESGGLWRPERCAPARYEGELFIGTNYRLSELEAAVNVAQFDKLGRYCAEYRKVSRRIMGQLETYREIRPQTINDRDGFIGYMLRFFPDTDERAASITQALVAEGISAHHRGDAHKPDYHLARDMFPINLKTGHIPGASVFDDPRNARSRDLGGYRPGQCPVSEKLFGREVSISLEHWYGDEDCDSIARGINKVLSAHCTPDDRGKAWI